MDDKEAYRAVDDYEEARDDYLDREVDEDFSIFANDDFEGDDFDGND